MKGFLKECNFFPDGLSGINTMEECEAYIVQHCLSYETFHHFLNEKIGERSISVPELMKKSCINKNYGYNILNGVRKKPSRDKTIALCIAARMTLEETQYALILARQPILFWKDERDVRIAFGIKSEIFDVMKLNIILTECGVAPLEV